MTPDNIETLIITAGVIAVVAMVLWASVRVAKELSDLDSYNQGFDDGVAHARSYQWSWNPKSGEVLPIGERRHD